MEPRACVARVTVRDAQGAILAERDLGEFGAVWSAGVSIGSDAGCTVVLPGLPPVAVRVLAAANHKLLYRLPPGTGLPLPPPTWPMPQRGERVDHAPFRVGPYEVSFSEDYRLRDPVAP